MMCPPNDWEKIVTVAAIICFAVFLVDMCLGVLRIAQGRDSAYIHLGLAVIFFLLGLNEMGVF